MKHGKRWFRAALVLAAAGCAAPPGPIGSLEVLIGEPTAAFAGFRPIASGQAVEVVEGIQGLTFLRVRYQVARARPGRVEVEVSVKVPGMSCCAPTSTSRGLEQQPDGTVLTEVHMLLLVDQAPAALHGRLAHLSVLLTDEAGSLGAITLDVELRDDDPCVDQGAGICT